MLFPDRSFPEPLIADSLFNIMNMHEHTFKVIVQNCIIY